MYIKKSCYIIHIMTTSVNTNINKYSPSFSIITTPYNPNIDGTGITIIFPDECLIEIIQDIDDNVYNIDDDTNNKITKIISILPPLPVLPQFSSEYPYQIPSINFDTESDSSKLHAYAVTFNALRIMSGLAGLSYSN